MVSKVRAVLNFYNSSKSFWIVVGVLLLCTYFVSRIDWKPVWGYSVSRPTYKTAVITDIPRPLDIKKASKSKRTTEILGVNVARSRTFGWRDVNPSASGVRFGHSTDKQMWEVTKRMPNLEYLDLSKLKLIQGDKIEEHLSEWYKRLKKNNSEEYKWQIENRWKWFQSKNLFFEPNKKHLEKLTHLKAIILPQCVYEKGSLSFLEKYSQLEWLAFPENTLIQDIPILENVETLQVTEKEQLSTHFLKRLKMFPRLKTLCIIYQYRFDSNQFRALSHQQIKLIRELPHLKTLYHPRLVSFDGKSLQSKLPHLNLIPTQFNTTRMSGALLMLFMGFLCSCALGLSLLGQFSRPEITNTPSVSKPHKIAGLVLCFLLCELITINLVIMSIETKAAVAISIFSLFGLSIISLPSRLHRNLFLLLGLPALLFVLLCISFFTPTVEMFLSGHHFLLTALVGIAGLSILVFTFLNLDTVYHRLIKLNHPTPIYGLIDFIRIARNENSKPGFWSRRFPILNILLIKDLDFQRLSSNSKASPERKRYEIWKQAGHFSRLFFPIIGLLLVMSFEAYCLFDPWNQLGLHLETLDTHKYLWLVICGLTYLLLFIVSVGWWRRTPMLSKEFCFPIARPELLRNIYRGLISDLAWIPFAILGILSVRICLIHSPIEGILWFIAFLISAIGILSCGYSVTLWIMLVRSQWKASLLAILIILGIFIHLFVPMTLFINYGENINAYFDLMLVGFQLLVLGTLLSLLAHYRWKRLEFAKLV